MSSNGSWIDLKRERLEFFREQEAKAADAAQKFQLRKEIEELEAEIAAATASPAEPAGPVWNVPFQRNEFFTGRDDVLEKLHEALHRERSAAVGQAISGLGGIGKTQTAVEFCYRYRDKYRAVFWVGAETEAELVQGFVEIARELGLPEKDAQEQEITVQAVRRWLGQKDGWLLVLDNADTPSLVAPYLPTPPRGHVLLTSRASSFDVLHMDPFKLEVFSRDDACLFLLKRARREDPPEEEREAAFELADELGYLPLALEQAVAFISNHGSRFVDYLSSFHRRRLKLLSKGRLRDYRKPVATTWSLNFEQIAEDSEAAAEILRVSAFLSPDQIPEELLIRGAEGFRDPLSEALRGCEEDPLILDSLLQALSRYSLIERDREDRSFSVHRMVQEVARQSLEGSEKRSIAESSIAALNQAYPGVDVPAWPLCDRLVPHWRVAAETTDRLDLESKAAGNVLGQAGSYAHERVRYGEAAPLFERALQIREKVLGEDHPHVATSLNNLAMLHKDQGEYTLAAPLLERALQIDEKVLGEEHPEVATDLNNLAMLHKDQGEYTLAAPLFERALQIREKVLGEDHPHVATSLNDLAMLYHAQGEYALAAPLLERALQIYEKVLGEDHPHVATCLHNLAGLHKGQGEYTLAAPLYKRALKIKEKVLGEDHPKVANSLNDLANLHQDQGEYTLAAPLYKRALQIYEKVLGEDHPHVATCLHNLAGLHKDQGEYALAAPLYERALQIYEKVLGEDHPKVANSLHGLARLHKAQSNYTQARPLYERALQIQEKVLGAEHPQVAVGLNDLAKLHEAQGDYARAVPLYERALQIYEKVLGGGHPHTQTARENYERLQKLMAKSSKK